MQNQKIFEKTTLWAKEKNCLFPSERQGEIFFPTMRPVNFFRNNKWILKNIKQKKKTEKKERKMRSVEK